MSAGKQCLLHKYQGSFLYMCSANLKKRAYNYKIREHILVELNYKYHNLTCKQACLLSSFTVIHMQNLNRDGLT